MKADSQHLERYVAREKKEVPQVSKPPQDRTSVETEGSEISIHHYTVKPLSPDVTTLHTHVSHSGTREQVSMYMPFMNVCSALRLNNVATCEVMYAMSILHLCMCILHSIAAYILSVGR